MGKKRRRWNEKQYQKYIKEGRGQGIGAEYIPWIKIQDFPSNGVCSRIRGRTTGRIHHLLSRNESAYFYLLDCSENVSFAIEQAYWKCHAVDWKIITEKQIDFEKSRNLQWLYYGQPFEELVPDLREQDRILAAFLDMYETSGLPLPDAIEIIETCHTLTPGGGVAAFKKLIILGLIRLDLSQRIDPAEMYCRKERINEIS